MSDVRLLQKSTYTYMKALPAYRAKIRSLYVQSVEHAAVICFSCLAAACGSKLKAGEDRRNRERWRRRRQRDHVSRRVVVGSSPTGGAKYEYEPQLQ